MLACPSGTVFFVRIMQERCPYISGTLSANYKNVVPDWQESSFYLTDEFVRIFEKIDCSGMKASQVTNIDCTFNNMIRDKNGRVKLFDFEWVFSFPVPYEYTAWRVGYLLYGQYRVYLRNIISQSTFLNEIGIDDSKQMLFQKMDDSFMEFVYGKGYKAAYMLHYKKNSFMQNIRVY